jgi:hypothetical protein
MSKKQQNVVTSPAQSDCLYSPAQRLADDLWQRSSASRPDDQGYVSFGDVARMRLGNQCQYISRYVNRNFSDDPAYPYLGDDLRITGSTNNYHSLRIHREDVDLFVERVREFLRHRLAGRR